MMISWATCVRRWQVVQGASRATRVALCMMLLCPPAAGAQAGVGRSERPLHGATFDAAGRAVGGVTLRLVERGLETVSDSLGQFAFDGVPDGTVTIAVSRAGFVSLVVSVPVSASDTARVPLLLVSLDESFERAVAPGTLFGVVSNTEGLPIGGVELTVLATGQRTVTDSLGRYMMQRTDPAARRIRLRKIGFTPQQIEISQDSGVATRADLTLGKLAAVLETAVVRADRTAPRLRAFFQRMERDTRNQFVTRDQIDFTRNGFTTDLLTRLRGVTLGYNSAGHPIPIYRMRCPMRVLVNGQEFELETMSLNGIVPLRDIAGVEAYTSPGEIPTDFWFGFTGSATSLECGVIGIWTRPPEAKAPKKKR